MHGVDAQAVVGAEMEKFSMDSSAIRDAALASTA